MFRAIEDVDGARGGLGGDQVRILGHVSSAIDLVLVWYALDYLDSGWVWVSAIASEFCQG